MKNCTKALCRKGLLSRFTLWTQLPANLVSYRPTRKPKLPPLIFWAADVSSSKRAAPGPQLSRHRWDGLTQTDLPAVPRNFQLRMSTKISQTHAPRKKFLKKNFSEKIFQDKKIKSALRKSKKKYPPYVVGDIFFYFFSRKKGRKKCKKIFEKK